MHCLRFYIPVIMDKTRKIHHCGVGFNMQGFKRRNKESKNVCKRFNNRKGNIMSQMLVRLWDNFYYNKSAVEK